MKRVLNVFVFMRKMYLLFSLNTLSDIRRINRKVSVGIYNFTLLVSIL